jgi:hypothetical protein
MAQSLMSAYGYKRTLGVRSPGCVSVMHDLQILMRASWLSDLDPAATSTDGSMTM